MSETDGDKAVILLETTPSIPDTGGNKSWAKKGACAFEEICAWIKPDEVKDWKVDDEKKTVGDHEFTCKKVSATTASDEIVIWLSSEVPVTGIVAMTRKSNLGEGTTEIFELEIGGFASAEPQATWGKNAADLAKTLEGDKK
jgi:hypothetical protein